MRRTIEGLEGGESLVSIERREGSSGGGSRSWGEHFQMREEDKVSYAESK